MSHFGQPAALRKRLIKFALISKNWAEVLILMAVLQLIFTSTRERQWQTNRHWCFHPATSHYREGSQQLCVYTSLCQSFPSDFHYYICTSGQWRLRWRKSNVILTVPLSFYSVFALSKQRCECEVILFRNNVWHFCCFEICVLLMQMCSDTRIWKVIQKTWFPTAVYAEMSQQKKLTTRFPLFVDKSRIQAWQ